MSDPRRPSGDEPDPSDDPLASGEAAGIEDPDRIDEAELDDFGRDARGRIPADRAQPDDFADDIIPAPPRYRADGERELDAELDAAAVGSLADASQEEVLAATADLDDDGPADLPPSTAPLTLEVVERILDARRPESQISPTLDRIAALMDLLGSPQRAYPVIQIGGTNGKTSTARMIEALCNAVGVRTGRFTSPHLQSVVERFSVDSAPIEPDRYAQLYGDVAPYVDLVDAASARDGGVPLSKFEILTAMAYALFADVPVDVAVMEVGLGGTWDSTTVADATVAAIGPVGLDHRDYLGDSIAGIATVKAGIIKPGAIAVIGRQQPEALHEILRRAVEVDATVARFGSEFTVAERAFAVGGQRLTLQGLGGVYPDVFLPLAGVHQAENAAVALAAVEAFFGAGPGRQLSVEAVQDGFAATSSPGRLERVRTAGAGPGVWIDAAHNVDGARALAATLRTEFSFDRLVGVLAVFGDKDVAGILGELAGVFDAVVVTVNSSPRSLPTADLADLAAAAFGEDRVHTADDLPAAVELASALAAEAEGAAGVVVTGSVVSAGDVRGWAGLEPS